MQIKLEFDDEYLVRNAQRGAELVFGIAWEHEGEFYPSENWTDFGEAILGFWYGATLRLLAGADEDEYVFMDGDYRIRAAYDRRTGILELRPKRTDTVWRIPLVDLCGELIRAANVVDDEVARVGLQHPGRPTFQKTIETLREALSKANGSMKP